MRADAEKAGEESPAPTAAAYAQYPQKPLKYAEIAVFTVNR